MSRITIYQKPSCTTCREVFQILKNSGVDFNAVDYYVEPLTKDQLKSLIKKMGIAAREVLRTKDPLYQELKLAERAIPDDEIIDLMVKHPDLLQRPIVEKGARAVLARPAEKVKDVLS